MSNMLTTLEKPLYLLKEHIASEATILRAKHNGKGGFFFSKDAKGTSAEALYTVDSRSGLSAPRRLVRDASGEGILELWRNATGDDSYIGHPKGASPPLAVVAPRKTAVKDKVDVYIKSVAGAGNEETKLEIRGQDIWKRDTLVYHGNDVVMQLKFVNYITTYVPFSSNQWDVAVAQGFDLSLACAIVVYLGTTLYDGSKFRSSYGGGATDDQEVDGTSQKPLWSRPWFLGAVAGGAGGGAG